MDYTDNHFFIGIDVGHATSSITYFDLKKNTAEVINISGGFGRVTQETAMQLVDGEAVFGSYALTGDSPEFPTQFDLLSQGDLQAFAKQMIDYVYEINPKAALMAITVVLPRDTTSHERLRAAFATYGDRIQFASHDNCVIAYYHSQQTLRTETFAIIDYAHTGLRLSLYAHDKTIRHLLYFDDQQVGTEHLDQELLAHVTQLYLEQTGLSPVQLSETDKINLRILLHEHQQHLLSAKGKDIKLHLNFVFPPVSVTVRGQAVRDMITTYETRIRKLIRHHLQLNHLAVDTIHTVLQTGGGFEMPWARSLIEKVFTHSQVVRHTSAKIMPALGAAVISASRCQVVSPPPTLEAPQLGYDIGLLTNQGFQSILDTQLRVIPRTSTAQAFTLDIYKQTEDKTKLISVIDVDRMDRHHLSVELGVRALFANHQVTLTVTDLGFGDMASASGFERTYTIKERYLYDND